jgi:periplasmic protein TonB
LPTESRVRKWWEKPAVLAIAGTLAIHVLLVTFADAMVVLHPPIPDPPPAPKIEMVDVEVPPVVKPPPEKQPDVPPPPQTIVHHLAASHAPAPVASEPPPPTPPPPDSGGAPVVTEDNIAPSATGVPVAVGRRTTGHVGRGGTGTGTAAGSGAGSADTPAPMSVATIKTRAMPRGDYSYEQEKEYPAEAKRLGIEGKIRVKLIVDENGRVKSATLLNRLGHGLDELALRRANAIQFAPAKDTDDRPVTSVVVWTFDLELPK